MSLHSDITKYIHEFDYKSYSVKIVERKMQQRIFNYLYILDEKGNDKCYATNMIEKSDLSDLNICIPKIKNAIDEMILFYEKCAKKEADEKERLNWTGQVFKRGDFVHFKGNEKYKPYDTYVWTSFGHLGLAYYLVEHPDGHDRQGWLDNCGMGDGFECVHSSMLDEDVKYIQIDCKFTNETDELILIRETNLK